GKLIIRARRVQVADRLLPRRAYVELSVTDTGVGMTEDVRVRAVDPFFTTKPAGQGTGLGLSQVYAVARESGGSFEIESEIDRGTTVRLILPLGPTNIPPPAAIPAAPVSPAKTQPEAAEPASILVVDDDHLVR